MTVKQAAPEHLSYSQITEFLKCSHAWELKKLWKAPSLPSWYLIGGTVVHEVTADYDLHLHRTGESLGPEDLRDLFEVAWDEQAALGVQVEPDRSKWKAGGRGKEDADWWQKNGLKMVARWVDFREQSPFELLVADGEPAVELEMTAMRYGFPFRLGIDRLFRDPTSNQVVVVDLKTGKEPNSPYQLAFYRDAVFERYGLQVDWGFYWMSRTGRLGRPHQLNGITLDMTARMAQNVRKGIEAELFTPNLGPLCDYCDVAKFCASVGGSPALLGIGLDSATVA